MKNVLVISTSLRNRSNSHAIAEEFARGVKEAEPEIPSRAITGLGGWTL